MTARSPAVPGGALSALLGLLACAAILAGYFIPWISLSPEIRDASGLSRTKVEILQRRAIAREKDPEATASARKLLDGEALAGREWTAVLELAAEEGGDDFTPRQHRILGLAALATMLLPWLVAGLAVVLLATRVPARWAVRAGLGPLALIFALSRSRFFGWIVFVLLMAAGLLAGGAASVLWLASGREAGLALGLKLVAGGGCAAFLAGLFGFRLGSMLRGLIAALIVTAALLGAAFYYVTAR